MIVRPARQSDLEAILDLASQADFGFTSMVVDQSYWLKKLVFSEQCFAQRSQPAFYFFVLEKQDNVVGCAAIKVHAKANESFYSYKISKDKQSLSLVHDFEQTTELCSLFILPEYRNKISSHLLSYARLLYIALHRTAFTSQLIADIRGVCDEKGISPFWEAVGKHFYGMDFATADKLTGLGNKQFIQALKSELQVDMNFLPTTAKAVIGIPHPKSMPAFVLLTQQGFSYQNYVDIFDAGPTLSAFQEQLFVIKHARQLAVTRVSKTELTGVSYLIASVKEPFKAMATQLLLTDACQELTLSESIATQLNISMNEKVIIAPLLASEGK